MFDDPDDDPVNENRSQNPFLPSSISPDSRNSVNSGVTSSPLAAPPELPHLMVVDASGRDHNGEVHNEEDPDEHLDWKTTLKQRRSFVPQLHLEDPDD